MFLAYRPYILLFLMIGMCDGIFNSLEEKLSRSKIVLKKNFYLQYD